MSIDFSVAIPVYNEEESLPPLFQNLDTALEGMNCEILFVNDGSSDRTLELLEAKAKTDPRYRVVAFTRNFGQTAAMAAGFENAQGDIVVCLDADGQNDPADIPKLLEEMRAGADVVSGWRFNRQDAWLTRLLPSKIANAIISFVTGVPLHDYGCTLKAYRREYVHNLRLYGEMHRFIPAWCAWKGARVREVKVRHYPRTLGKSKYGLGRTFKVVLDLVTAKFFSSYLSNPSYFFGGFGLFFFVLSGVAGILPFIDKFFFDQWGHLRIPFMIFSVFMGLIGLQFVVLGLLAEILIRVYYENKNERPYRIGKILHFPR